MCEDYPRFLQADAEVLVTGPEETADFERQWNHELYPFVGIPDPEHVIADLFGQEVKILRMGRLPALMVIDKDGYVRHAHYGQSMRDILDTTVILDLLQRLPGNAESGRADQTWPPPSN